MRLDTEKSEIWGVWSESAQKLESHTKRVRVERSAVAASSLSWWCGAISPEVWFIDQFDYIKKRARGKHLTCSPIQTVILTIAFQVLKMVF